MQAKVKWVEDVMFVAESGSGHAIVLDGATENGGRNKGMRPLELMALSVGSCSSYDVVTILKKARQKVTGCEVEVTAKRADAVPAVFENIHLHFQVSGENLKKDQVKRAISLSAEKYCSASIMLSKGGVVVTHDFTVIESSNKKN
jgi:putative redox protein